MNTTGPPKAKGAPAKSAHRKTTTESGLRRHDSPQDAFASSLLAFLRAPSLRTFCAAFSHFNPTTTISPRGGTPEQKTKPKNRKL